MLIVSGFQNDRIFEKNIFIEDANWSQTQKLPFEFEITDTTGVYDFVTNIRIADNYPYSNIFILVYAYNPEGRLTKQLVEFKLAEDNGKWLGNGIGDLYDYKLVSPSLQQIALKHKGKYRFEFRQLMRTENLKGVLGVGLRVVHRSL